MIHLEESFDIEGLSAALCCRAGSAAEYHLI
jgi:hypothetical protein